MAPGSMITDSIIIIRVPPLAPELCIIIVGDGCLRGDWWGYHLPNW